MGDDTKLIPCPFCGGKAYPGRTTYLRPLDDAEWADGSPITETHCISCASCGGTNQGGVVGGYQTVDLAITAWNTRAAPPAMDREAVAGLHALQHDGTPLHANPVWGGSIIRWAVEEIKALRALSTLSADAIRQGEGKYLVWSNEHRAWWGPDHRGYTRAIERAGLYDRDEAFSISSTRGGGWERETNPDEIAIPEADAIAQYVGSRLATPASHSSDGGEGA